jgi:hypothetical protein
MTQSAETRYKELKVLATAKLKPDEESMALRHEGEAEGEWPGHHQAARAEGRGDQGIEGEEGASWRQRKGRHDLQKLSRGKWNRVSGVLRRKKARATR